ncbi:M3 family oligoendopeptidase [Tanticharoenia sakaeratensis]|uniref:Oligoendopeptidase F n=1 Tax=Tanticharoenia sakaeratensis NBRC 103193 TaxID=1231623 RepID=A0A0D6MLN0_9PROT|nr:M3 family oligoendopeptidase [Tanticharoenia sakaeratensis]GAN54310.1 oligoendopeptidase F [Tanticharoenia sakaeratensis NBRC 103193]GBQ18989.1 oligoendopeptidase F [Tanticharoenia sakaeratensis NBRC 103193]
MSRIFDIAAERGEAATPADLPRWDLSDLYASPDDPRIEADLKAGDVRARAFSDAWKGRLAGATPAQLAEAIGEYERIDEDLGRIASYAQLLFAANTADPAVGRFQQTINERMTDISAHLLFFTLELNRIDDADLDGKLADPALAHWRPFLRDLRVFRPYQLSDEVERVLMEKSVTARSAWTRLFDETMAQMTVTLDGETKPLDVAFNRLTDRDRSVREAAAREISACLGAQSRLLTLITNTLAKDKAIGDGLRGYERPGSSRNRGNMVEDSVVDALVSAVRDAYPRLSHRYYRMKARWLGLEHMEHWDRNAPLPGSDDSAIAWDEAKRIVRTAYTGFDPALGTIAGTFLDRPWIDAAPVPGKSSGAFAHPTVPSAHPYILMNYRGRARDVMTLAHELGHGIHQVLAARQGYFNSGTPLTLAETASVFGEMLTFQSLLDAQTDPARRRFLLASKVEDMLNTVVRQIAFYCFETRLHDERAKGELSSDRIGEIWREVQTESLGPAFEFTPDYDLYWSYVPHFVHSPFYVYAYAFGDCLVNALYGVYREGAPGFAERYRAMLEAGGTLRHKELLAPFGLDASDPGFWARGLDVISGFIDELEQGSDAHE